VAHAGLPVVFVDARQVAVEVVDWGLQPSSARYLSGGSRPLTAHQTEAQSVRGLAVGARIHEDCLPSTVANGS
jgi:hypothetical protein